MRITHVDGRDKNGRFSGNLERSTVERRITRMTMHWHKRTKQPEVRYSVDGEPVDSLEAAVALIEATPLPEVTPLHKAVLKQIGDDWREETGPVPIAAQELIEKGLIEHNRIIDGDVARNVFRRTPLGRGVLGMVL